MQSPSLELRQTLLELQRRDLEMREALAADGTLFDGYHPRMEEVHRDNAKRLRELIDRFGWPNEQLAGADGAEAAWLIAQHAIGEPDFMRMCRKLLEVEVASGAVPRWQLAYLDDRIRVAEGRSQRYGTQFEITPDGPQLCPVEEPESLDERRTAAGLDSIADRMKGLCHGPLPATDDYAARKQKERAWRIKVGWRSD